MKWIKISEGEDSTYVDLDAMKAFRSYRSKGGVDYKEDKHYAIQFILTNYPFEVYLDLNDKSKEVIKYIEDYIKQNGVVDL